MIAVLEALAVERAVVRLAADALHALEELHQRMRVAFEEGDRVTYFELNTQIHESLLAQAGNPILIETQARLMLRVNRGRYLALRSQHRWHEAMEQHEALMESLREGDSAGAAKIWREHLTMTGQTLLESLSDDSLKKSE